MAEDGPTNFSVELHFYLKIFSIADIYIDVKYVKGLEEQ